MGDHRPSGRHRGYPALTGIGQGLFQSSNTRFAGAVFAGLGGTAAGSALDGARAGGPTAPDVGALQQTFLAGFRGALVVSVAVAATASGEGAGQRPCQIDLDL